MTFIYDSTNQLINQGTEYWVNPSNGPIVGGVPGTAPIIVSSTGVIAHVFNGSALALDNGAYNVTVHGLISANVGSYSSFIEAAGISLITSFDGPSTVNVGPTGYIFGSWSGIVTRHATNVTNAGQIGGHIGLRMIANIASFNITNTGLIFSNDGSNAIEIYSTPNYSINNSGEIRGGIFASSLSGAATITNNSSGVINGTVRLSNAADTLTNNGQVNGTIHLGGGNDTFKGGSYAESVSGGSGDDRAIYTTASNTFGTSITRLADGSTKVVTAAGGVDIFRAIEHLQFSNLTLNVVGYARTDMNADGDSDVLIFSQSSGAVSRMDIQGGIQHGTGTSAVANPGSGAWDVQKTGDFNADGAADLVMKNQTTGQFQLWTTVNGTASFARDLGVIGTAWEVVSTGDYNSDGVHEILWRSSTTGQFYVWTFNAALQQNGSTPIGVFGSNWTGVPSGDFSGDGTSDILVRNSLDGDLYYFNLNNGAIQSNGHIGVFGTDWTVAGVGDFNGDTNSDIILKNTSTGQFYELQMNDQMGYTGISLGIIGTDWNIATTGDYNADSTDDILWRNSSTGQVYQWAMDNGVQAATGSAALGFLTADQILV